MPNSYKLLMSREYNKGNSLRLNLKVVNTLVCHKDATFVKVWEKHVSQPVTYEGGKLYFENHRTCLCIHGKKGLPQTLYKLPPCPTSQKIEDCILAQFPLNDIPVKDNGYRGCMLALTSHNHLLRYDIDTGQLLQDVYLSLRYKFRQLSWDTAGYTIVVRSTHEKISALARQANICPGLLMVLSVFTVFPLQCVAMMEIDKKIFGRDITDAMISQNVLILMHQGGVLRFYSFSHILQQNKLFDVKLGEPHPLGSHEGLIGGQPNGIPINIKIKERPPVLMEVKCSEHKLCIGGIPWHYIITPHGYHGVFNIHTMKNHKRVINGHLDDDSLSVEPDKCFFHADDSGRIIHIGAEQVRVLKLHECVSKEPDTEEYMISEAFIIHSKQQVPQSQERNITYTSSGRAVKRKYISSDSLYDNKYESIQTVDYEDDLDLLVITAVQQCDDHYQGKVQFYNNQTGQLKKEIPLVEPWKEFCDHVVAVDIDTIVHIVKGPMRKFDVYVYRLDRSIPKETHQVVRRTSKRGQRSPRSSVNEVDNEQVVYTSIRTSRRSTRSYSSIR